MATLHQLYAVRSVTAEVPAKAALEPALSSILRFAVPCTSCAVRCHSVPCYACMRNVCTMICIARASCMLLLYGNIKAACTTGDSPGESRSALVSPRNLSASTAPIAQSLKGLFQRPHTPPVPLPTGGVLAARRNSAEQHAASGEQHCRLCH